MSAWIKRFFALHFNDPDQCCALFTLTDTHIRKHKKLSSIKKQKLTSISLVLYSSVRRNDHFIRNHNFFSPFFLSFISKNFISFASSIDAIEKKNKFIFINCIQSNVYLWHIEETTISTKMDAISFPLLLN